METARRPSEKRYLVYPRYAVEYEGTLAEIKEGLADNEVDDYAFQDLVFYEDKSEVDVEMTRGVTLTVKEDK